jgi:hypothetical protein
MVTENLFRSTMIELSQMSDVMLLLLKVNESEASEDAHRVSESTGSHRDINNISLKLMSFQESRFFHAVSGIYDRTIADVRDDVFLAKGG